MPNQYCPKSVDAVIEVSLTLSFLNLSANSKLNAKKLGYDSGVDMGSIHEKKTRGRESRATVSFFNKCWKKHRCGFNIFLLSIIEKMG